MQDLPTERVRVDKWLWAARFFKTRTLAAKAVSGGHVHVSGVRVKPAHLIAVGDMLEIHRGHQRLTIRVHAVSRLRGTAAVAQSLYEETPESVGRREGERVYLAQSGEVQPRPETRPDKHARRRIRKFLRKD